MREADGRREQYLFIVDHKTNSNLRVIGPFRIEACFAVADKVALSVVVRVSAIPHWRHGCLKSRAKVYVACETSDIEDLFRELEKKHDAENEQAKKQRHQLLLKNRLKLITYRYRRASRTVRATPHTPPPSCPASLSRRVGTKDPSWVPACSPCTEVE